MQDQFLIAVYIASILIHVVAFVIHSTWVIPLQIREAHVKNGLRTLRYLMLASGLTMMTISVVSILVLSARFFVPSGKTAQLFYIILILFHSLGFLAFAYIKKLMYHQQYSERQKELHEKIDIMEKKEAREEARLKKLDK